MAVRLRDLRPQEGVKGIEREDEVVSAWVALRERLPQRAVRAAVGRYLPVETWG